MLKSLQEIYENILFQLDSSGLTEAHLARSPILSGLDVIAVGKAAVAMARGANSALGQQISRGFLLTKTAHIDSEDEKVFSGNFVLREASHPIPDENGMRASQELLSWIPETKADELLVLVSGGTSSLLVAPNSPLGLAELQEINQGLLASGFPIEEINILRKHLSQVKGGKIGQVATAHYQKIRQLVLVDICAPELEEKEILSLVGSGCFVADPSSVEEAEILLARLENLMTPELYKKATDALNETPENLEVESVVLASHQSLRDEALALIGKDWAHPDWPTVARGDIRDLAETFAKTSQSVAPSGQIFASSGEPTVRLNSELLGRGGRCQELALYFAKLIAGRDGVNLLAGSSDGTDGPTEYAGAIVDGQTWPKLCQKVGSDKAEALLNGHASTEALELVPGSLLKTGPTGQNLNDLFLLQLSSSGP